LAFFLLAQRAFCASEIRFRAAADILRRPRVPDRRPPFDERLAAFPSAAPGSAPWAAAAAPLLCAQYRFIRALTSSRCAFDMVRPRFRLPPLVAPVDGASGTLRAPRRRSSGNAW